MISASRKGRALLPIHGVAGAGMIAFGEALIVARDRPLSDFYFPFVWLGYILLLDAAVYRTRGRSLLMNDRTRFLAMFPMSAAFWWVFEAFNQTVHNWTYIGTQPYSGLGYVAFASIDFATVLPGVWCSAMFIDALLAPSPPAPPPQKGEGRLSLARSPASALREGADGSGGRERMAVAMFITGLICLALPIVLPHYFFGMIWLCMFFLLDPINYRLGRPSMLRAVKGHNWRLPISFALGGLMCGVFWEGWNYWSMPKWIYTIPYVNHVHIFEMPLLGWSGYLPFGLELFAMANFLFPLLGLLPGHQHLLEQHHEPKEEDAHRTDRQHIREDPGLV